MRRWRLGSVRCRCKGPEAGAASVCLRRKDLVLVRDRVRQEGRGLSCVGSYVRACHREGERV